MKVINNVPWSGQDFAYTPGDEIEIPDAVATARIKEGLCSRITEPTKPVEPVKPAVVKSEPVKPAEPKAVEPVKPEPTKAATPPAPKAA